MKGDRAMKTIKRVALVMFMSLALTAMTVLIVPSWFGLEAGAQVSETDLIESPYIVGPSGVPSVVAHCGDVPGTVDVILQPSDHQARFWQVFEDGTIIHQETSAHDVYTFTPKPGSVYSVSYWASDIFRSDIAVEMCLEPATTTTVPTTVPTTAPPTTLPAPTTVPVATTIPPELSTSTTGQQSTTTTAPVDERDCPPVGLACTGRSSGVEGILGLGLVIIGAALWAITRQGR